MKVKLTHGKRQFDVDVEFLERKRLSITVHPDLHITAKAPINTDRDVIKKRLEKRVGWIAKQLNYFERFQPLPPERAFISGETHYYLGRQYRLKIRSGSVQRVRLIGRFFEMELHDTGNNIKAREIMMHWYSDHARELLVRRLSQYLSVFVKMGIPAPEIRLRRMKRRWGSCSANGVIILNTELVKAPIHCVDYVLVHELCHLKYPNHDKKFFQLLRRILPDWEKRKERLEKVVI